MFGLFYSQMFTEIDYLQTYLIGLKCYTTGTWPWFGPDVNGLEAAFKSQIPGALEGLLIGLPFHVLPIPEAPFILVNLLSITGVALLAWYIHKRLPGLPYAWLFAWIAVCPWSIHETTTVINPAYIFLPAVLFFIGFMESLPFFTLGLVTAAWANAAMGFSFFWIMQLHFTYVFLVPLILFSMAVQILPAWRPKMLKKGQNLRFPRPQSRLSALGLGMTDEKKSKRALLSATSEKGRSKFVINPVLFFVLGSIPMLALLVPTYLEYGLARGNVASGFAVPFNWKNFLDLGTILAQFLSLVSFELPRFLGINTYWRFHFLAVDHPYLFLPGIFLWVGGLLQPLVLLLAWFKKGKAASRAKTRRRPVLPKDRLGFSFLVGRLAMVGNWFSRENAFVQWEGIRWLTLAVFLMAYASFWFTLKRTQSHLYLVLFPLIMTYSCYCWATFQDKKHWRILAKAFIISGVFFQFSYALIVMPRESIYPKWNVIKQAIDGKNYHLLGERRPESLY